MNIPKHDGSILVPSALDFERTVIGTCFSVDGAIDMVAAKITAEDFYSHAYAEIYRVLLEMHNNNEPVNIYTVASKVERLKKTELVEHVTGAGESLCTIGNIEYYLNKIITKSKLRSLIKIGNEVMAWANESDDDDEVIDHAASSLQDIIHSRSGSKIQSATEVMRAMTEDMYSRHSGKVMGYKTGISALDEVIGEFSKGDLVVIAGRPSQGKTAIATSIMLNQLEAGTRIGFISIEMKAKAIGYRMVSAITGINLFKIMHGMTAKRELPEIQCAIGKIADSSIWIDDTPNLTATQVRAIARQMVMVHKIEILYVDHLHCMDYGDVNPTIGYGKITKVLKSVAKDIDIPVVLLSQLARIKEKAKDKKPTLQDLRWSGDIEQDADVVFFVHREEMYTHKDEDKGKVELIVAKQRNGPTETAVCEFVAQSAHFRDVQTTNGF